ncbi:hypothetical protein E4M02_04105 [Brevundimonas sp. S30B]|uniref:hypothetical protein n=1 Tax=unclassified Brevundimonas TaxID=2622653 RepID=UPI0010722E13|nr:MULTISPECIES: hypothetical protein [unclassified Brevundimonas]QBX36942.1 hypothetical protein E4M01_03710 [Brevundimonas sp. MF30-B]TFW04263.1 hypothetical protein E4M02_04105 [Brevundimonas sp. S30B]
MKSLALALMLAAAPVAVLAQTVPSAQGRPVAAAGAAPNTFDDPSARAAAPQAAAQAAQAQPADQAQAPDVARAERTLREVIAAAQSGEFDYSVFSDSLAVQIRAQSAQVTPLVQGFGALRSVTYAGEQQGADLFEVVFANAETQWIIGFDEDDKVGALLFRPKPEE